MIPLHCSTFPEARLPRTPDDYLRTWRNRTGLRNSITSDALNFLEELGQEKVMVCENAPDPLLANLRWSIYQDRTQPQLFVVIGKLGTTEFGTIKYLAEKTPVLEREGFTYQRLSQFRAVTEKMKEDFLGVTS